MKIKEAHDEVREEAWAEANTRVRKVRDALDKLDRHYKQRLEEYKKTAQRYEGQLDEALALSGLKAVIMWLHKLEARIHRELK